MAVRLYLLSILAANPLYGQVDDTGGHEHHHEHAMTMTAAGAVMNSNDSQLPRGCPKISRDYEFTVHAGSKYARKVPGHIFGFSEYEFTVDPCSRITLEFVNEDDVRHQWMVHGLPRYLYPGGMFHLEASGGQRQRGTFIVPPDARTYLIHCDMAQHMEKGMKGQLVVAGGDGDLWNVPGVSGQFRRGDYLPRNTSWWVAILALTGFFLTLALLRIRRR